ncbi:hypothetical protein NE619_02150 [Anaerovorax odorimutans]|uniref:Adhesin domain-containing protein n=1 Tax=Anaerovorax odorimutans TaxID=109327 RepID=A0ABT1RK03_9FIRM|nr:hypothetical protein [Anaerovorax odorimutans]MCQ4635518.1 hypothetical protein [Anaerovorax odorimutans]
MKKKKIRGAFIWLCILIAMMIIATAVNLLGEKEDGIEVSGGTAGKDWAFANPGLLKVRSDDVTISGTADADLKIECEGASQLTIRNLKQKNHKLYIFSTDDFTVNVEGNNDLVWISGWESVTVRGQNRDAELTLSEKASGKNLSVENVKACAELFDAEKDINIMGNSAITVKKVSDEEDVAADVRVKAGRYININLSPGGSVTVETGDGLLPFLAEKKMTLGKNNEILTPENGVVEGENTPYGPNCYFVFDEDGDWGTDVVIKNTAKE